MSGETNEDFIIEDLERERDQLRAENERLRTIIDASKAVVTDAENQAEARLHADVENEKLRGVLREIANSAGIDGCGYTTGEGHSDCVWKARKALNEVTK